MSAEQKDGIWGDRDSPVLPIGSIQSTPVSRSGNTNHTELSSAAPTDLQTALESCGHLMLALGASAVQDPQQVLALEQSLKSVVQYFRTPLNGARPINRIPPEILSTIFRLVVGPIKATNLRHVLRLSSICRHWRAITLAHGAMWSNIRLVCQNPNFVFQQVERCRGVPLHLSIALPYVVFRTGGEPYLARFKQVAPIIKALRNQVRSISALSGDFRAFRQELGLDWPNLEELDWVDVRQGFPGVRERNPPVPDEDRSTPKLRYLSAKWGLPWEMKSVTSLTTLKLEAPMNIDVFKLLQATPHLESLELVRSYTHLSPAQPTSINMPRLTRLAMRNFEYGQLFMHIILPSLRNLYVNPIADPGEPVGIIWGKIQVPPAITVVKIEYPAHRSNEISITGSNEAETHTLNLKEYATRSPRMTQALCNASLASVTTLSVGRGVPELGVQLPSTPVCVLISGLPHLRRLVTFPSQFTLAVMEYLRDHPIACPELRILNLSVVRWTCEEVFKLLLEFVTNRANSKRWLHRIGCVVLKAGGNPLETSNLWNSMSQRYELGKYLRCDGDDEDACWRAQCAEAEMN